MKNSLLVMISLSLGAALLGLSGKTASAAAPFSEFAIGPDLGTTGIGAQITTPLIPKYVDLTGGFSEFDIGFKANAGGERYHANIRVGGVPIYLSTYPFGPHFHLDAGLFINETRIGWTAVPKSGGIYAFDGHDYEVSNAGVISGRTHYAKIAPYFGVGWGNPLLGSQRWSFLASAGVFLQGSSRVGLAASDPQVASAAMQNIASARHKFDSEISFLSAFPVVTLGVTCRF